jgi:hypothetical protein
MIKYQCEREHPSTYYVIFGDVSRVAVENTSSYRNTIINTMPTYPETFIDKATMETGSGTHGYLRLKLPLIVNKTNAAKFRQCPTPLVLSVTNSLNVRPP